MTTTAKLFWTGNSQAIRLPKAFRFNTDKVRIEKQGNKLIIEPVIQDWEWLDSLGQPDPSWAEAVVQGRQEMPVQHRKWNCFE